MAAVQKSDFWKMPTEERRRFPYGPDGRKRVNFHGDGAQWILEGIENGKYHVVDR